MGPYKLQQPPRRWSCPREPTSITANAQRKNKNKIRRAWLAHSVQPILTANLSNPTCLVNLQTFSNHHVKPYYGLETLSKGIKITPKTRKSSKVIPEMAEKVRLAITRQQLARNMKKNKKSCEIFWFFLVFLITRLKLVSLARPWKLMI